MLNDLGRTTGEEKEKHQHWHLCHFQWVWILRQQEKYIGGYKKPSWSHHLILSSSTENRKDLNRTRLWWPRKPTNTWWLHVKDGVKGHDSSQNRLSARTLLTAPLSYEHRGRYEQPLSDFIELCRTEAIHDWTSKQRYEQLTHDIPLKWEVKKPDAF